MECLDVIARTGKIFARKAGFSVRLPEAVRRLQTGPLGELAKNRNAGGLEGI
jgi:hypothetical protein